MTVKDNGNILMLFLEILIIYEHNVAAPTIEKAIFLSDNLPINLETYCPSSD